MKIVKYILSVLLVLALFYSVYRCVPEGKEYLTLIFNATGLAGAAAILGVFYKKGKEEENTTKTKTKINNSMTQDEYPDIEDIQKGWISSNNALLLQIDHFKFILKKITKDRKLSIDIEKDFIEDVFHSTEESFFLRENELIKDGFERVSKRMQFQFMLKQNAEMFFTPERWPNPILSSNYILEDKSAENKIIMKFYHPKNNMTLLKTNPPNTEVDIPLLGYTIFGIYYNTSIMVRGFLIGERTIVGDIDIEKIKKKIEELQ